MCVDNIIVYDHLKNNIFVGLNWVGDVLPHTVCKNWKPGWIHLVLSLLSP